MARKDYDFETGRLVVREWHSPVDDEWSPPDLRSLVASILTPAVTEALPEAWQGDYTVERAQAWIEERDREGPTLLAIERSSHLPAGLIVLFEIVGSEGVDVRLGYLLAESAWGKGLATELVQGFVESCRATNVATIVGGVGRDNVASRRVLEKSGFVCVPGDGAAAEQLFELRMRPG